MSFTTRDKIPRCGNAHDIAVSLAPIAVMVGVPLLVWLLAGCTPVDHPWTQMPLNVDCQGKVIMTAIGAVGPFGGVNGSITADCGPGAYMHVNPAPAPATP